MWARGSISQYVRDGHKREFVICFIYLFMFVLKSTAAMRLWTITILERSVHLVYISVGSWRRYHIPHVDMCVKSHFNEVGVNPAWGGRVSTALLVSIRFLQLAIE